MPTYYYTGVPSLHTGQISHLLLLWRGKDWLKTALCKCTRPQACTQIYSTCMYPLTHTNMHSHTNGTYCSSTRKQWSWWNLPWSNATANEWSERSTMSCSCDQHHWASNEVQWNPSVILDTPWDNLKCPNYRRCPHFRGSSIYFSLYVAGTMHCAPIKGNILTSGVSF